MTPEAIELIHQMNTTYLRIMAFGLAFVALFFSHFPQYKKIAYWLAGFAVLCAVISGCVSMTKPVDVARHQGNTGACAPYALAKYIEITQGYRMSDDEVEELYDASRAADMHDDAQTGCDVGVMLYVARRDELIKGDVQLRTVEDVKDALFTSPVLLSLPVYGQPKMWGAQFWGTTGTITGHHSIVCTEYSGGIFTLLNSYGPAWGSNGRCWLWEGDLEKMLGLSPSKRAQAWVVK